MRRSAAWTLVLLAVGCGDVGQDEGPVDDGEAPHEVLRIEHFQWDILLVIDDSVGMGEVQARLAEAAAGVFTAEGSCKDGRHRWTETNFRVGFTTTSVANPWCGEALDPGGLRVESCVEQLDEFVSGDVDFRDRACRDGCALEPGQLEILPTFLAYDGDKPRPWLEHIDGVENFTTGTAESFADALMCVVPQGIAGCQYASPLEAMRIALERAQTPGDPSFGFLRDEASLLVAIVTDSVDCSLGVGGAAIFDPEGRRALWTDPDTPTQGICWSAGTQCTGDPTDLDCQVAHRGVDGASVDPVSAVLRDIDEYVDVLGDIEDGKLATSKVVISVVGGFTQSGSTWYGQAGDPETQAEYGIEPVCDTIDGITAMPPVRLRDMVSAVSPYSAHSVCAAGDIPDVFEPAVEHTCPGMSLVCYPGCASDSDPELEGLQPTCDLWVEAPGEPMRSVPECLKGADGQYPDDPEAALPPGESLCGRFVTEPTDDFPDAVCDHDDGENLGFDFTRREGTNIQSGTRFLALCETGDEC